MGVQRHMDLGSNFGSALKLKNEEQTFCFYYPKNGSNNHNRERHTVKIND